MVKCFGCQNVKASPPGNGGRGLKHPASRANLVQSPGIASRKRRAWIETGFGGAGMMRGRGIASRKRGAWIETCLVQWAPTAGGGIASRKRGAWIETDSR